VSAHRKQLLQWTQQGHLNAESLPEALRLTRAEPSPSDWQQFIDKLMLWFGSICMVAGVVFFFAYNWQQMGRFAKFGLVEVCILATVALCWKLGLDRLSGKAALFASTILVGALLALVGQTYQTGADPWQLFAAWAAMIIPWVAIGRFGALLLFWVGLVNLSLFLYFQTFPRFLGLFGVLFGTETLLWIFFIFNTAILCLWEYAAQRQIAWLSERWPLRVMSLASGSLITILAVWAILDFREFGIAGPICYLVWLAVAYIVYRHKVKDLFVLAGGVLSVVIVVTVLLARGLFDHGADAGSFLIIGLMVIGLSAAGGMWLKSIAQENQS